MGVCAARMSDAAQCPPPRAPHPSVAPAPVLPERVQRVVVHLVPRVRSYAVAALRVEPGLRHHHPIGSAQQPAVSWQNRSGGRGRCGGGSSRGRERRGWLSRGWQVGRRSVRSRWEVPAPRRCWRLDGRRRQRRLCRWRRRGRRHRRGRRGKLREEFGRWRQSGRCGGLSGRCGGLSGRRRLRGLSRLRRSNAPHRDPSAQKTPRVKQPTYVAHALCGLAVAGCCVRCVRRGCE